MADFIEDDNVKQMGEKLVEVWHDRLGHIDHSKLKWVREISASQRTLPGACLPVYPPYNLLNPDVIYIIAVYYKSDWDNLTDPQRVALVMHQLLHISEKFDGGIVNHDVQDWGILVDSFGADYLSNKDLPDLRVRPEDDVHTVAEEALG